MNVEFEYLYRDAGNNKIWGSIVLLNRENVDLNILKMQIREVLIDHEFFIAQKSGLPKLSFEKSDLELDHDWYEYSSLNEMTDYEGDIFHRDIKDFIDTLKQASLI